MFEFYDFSNVQKCLLHVFSTFPSRRSPRWHGPGAASALKKLEACRQSTPTEKYEWVSTTNISNKKKTDLQKVGTMSFGKNIL